MTINGFCLDSYILMFSHLVLLRLVALTQDFEEAIAAFFTVSNYKIVLNALGSKALLVEFLLNQSTSFLTTNLLKFILNSKLLYTVMKHLETVVLLKSHKKVCPGLTFSG